MADSGELIETGATSVLDPVRGMVMSSQTCDAVRGCRGRPFVEVAPLIEMTRREVEAVRRLKRPAFAYIPATAGECLVAEGVTLKLIHHAARLQGNGMTLSGIVTSRR